MKFRIRVSDVRSPVIVSPALLSEQPVDGTPVPLWRHSVELNVRRFGTITFRPERAGPTHLSRSGVARRNPFRQDVLPPIDQGDYVYLRHQFDAVGGM